MKLYFTPGACSMAPHIALHEADLAFETEKVDLRTKQTAGGADFKQINAKGSVPALQLDDGAVLTEVALLLQYIGDQVPTKLLIPPAGTMPRYRLQEWLNFIATELHKGFGPLFNPQTPDAMKAIVKENLAAKFTYLSSRLGESGPYVMGDFSVADAYLFTVLGWTKPTHIDLSPWPAIESYLARVAARPAVQATLKAEGLS